MNTRIISVLVSWMVLAFSSGARIAAQRPSPQPFTLDDEMKMRAIVDVRISPNGDRVAYVLSTPSLAKNEHEAALFVVASRGGTPARLGDVVHIFNTPVPRPQLRWSPDSSTVSLVGLAGDRPQVFAIPLSGAAPRALTAAPEGVFAHEWSPDGKALAYLTRDGMTPDEARRRQDKSFVIRADAGSSDTAGRTNVGRNRATRLDARRTLRGRFLMVTRQPRAGILCCAAQRLQRAVRNTSLQDRS